MLTPEEIMTFRGRGYIVVDGVLSHHKIDAVLEDFRRVAERIAEQRFEPNQTAQMREWSLDNLLIALTRHTGESLAQHFDISLPPRESAISADTPINTSAAIFDILTDTRLLDVVEDLIGGEIWSNPTQHVRVKLPERELAHHDDGLMGRVPWHQDNGVLTPDADDSHIVTVWAPLRAATARNGCLQVIPNSHATGLQEHCLQPGGYGVASSIVSEMGAAHTLEMKAGSVLLMHQRTLHRSLPNTSDRIRFSLDLRYQPTGEASGRPQFPGFVARSKRDRHHVVESSATWSARWVEARRRLSSAPSTTAFFRWPPDGEPCA